MHIAVHKWEHVDMMMMMMRSTYQAWNFLKGGRITTRSPTTQCRPIFTPAKSPRTMHSGNMIVFEDDHINISLYLLNRLVWSCNKSDLLGLSKWCSRCRTWATSCIQHKLLCCYVHAWWFQFSLRQDFYFSEHHLKKTICVHIGTFSKEQSCKTVSCWEEE